MNLPGEYFQEFNFKQSQLRQYLETAERDLIIAKESIIPDVVFRFCYDSLIKIGIFTVAINGYRVRSKAGHHIKIIEQLSEIMADPDISIVGNRMRKERNRNLYEAGFCPSVKDSQEYLTFVEAIYNKAKKQLK